MSQLYNNYVEKLRKIADVKYAMAVLQWDQEVYQPAKGAALRGQQMATLSEIAHNMFADEALGTLLQDLLQTDLKEDERCNVELTWYDYQKNKKYSGAFVRNMSEAVTKSYHAWIEARKQNDFAIFQEPLKALVDLKREETQLLGFADHPYDALLNEYERGATVKFLDGVFDSLQEPLHDLLQKIKAGKNPENDFLHQHFDKDAQWKFGITLLERMGYDFEAGRQDISEHPFTTNFSTQDVRVTTRIDENDLTSMTWSCIHEGGHALYEQGLPVEQYGLPLGEFCSLGIHESQSRLWENCIGRSAAFIQYQYPLIQESFPQLGKVSTRSFYNAINKVQPSFIRTEADELTYHFHVLIRYNLEKKLIEGSLEVKDIPAYWNEQYKKWLGVEVQHDKQGCLQDIHWSHGSFGYFPTYSLGSFYAAQFFATIQKANPTVLADIANGNYHVVHKWMQQHVYQYGRRFTSNELCNKATGEPLNLTHFIAYATEKYQNIYGF